MKKGDHVKAKYSQPHAPKGTQGRVKSIHHGTTYAVMLGAGVAFLPAVHTEPVGTEANPDPDSDNDNDLPGSKDLATRWEALMAVLIAAEVYDGPLQQGDLVTLAAEHAAVEPGDEGEIQDVYEGACYGVDAQGSMVYVPGEHVQWTDPAAISDGNNDQPTGLIPYNSPN